MTELNTEIPPAEKSRMHAMASDGKFVSIYEQRLRAHPKYTEIVDMIRNRKELNLPYRKLPEAIKEKFGITLGIGFLITFYRKNFVTDETLQYIYGTREKQLALKEELYELIADVHLELEARKLDFVVEKKRGRSIPGSSRRSIAAMKMMLEIFKMGAALGMFADNQFKPDTQSNQLNQNSMS